ncbi:hypothetical protein [Amycolatopsis panacis]|uniref:hypothetical protein n=1 Tax=Amycolatopsis panacis TaxID=2340917 RepID=UPI0011C49645|nr:hypothetical protein [Amycolatopsis panacis]
MASSESSQSAAARAALDNVDAARRQMASRLTSPWWYHPGIGLSFGLAFASATIGWEYIPYGVIIGLTLLPTVLTTVARRVTGVSIDRYRSTPSARWSVLVYALLFVVLAGAGIALQWGADLRWAMAGCGALVFVLTVYFGRRIEAALVRDARSGT